MIRIGLITIILTFASVSNAKSIALIKFGDELKKVLTEKNFSKAKEMIKETEDAQWCTHIDDNNYCSPTRESLTPKYTKEIGEIEQCFLTIQKSESKDLMRGEVKSLKAQIENECNKNWGNIGPEWASNYERAIERLESRKSHLPFTTKSDSPMAKALVEAQNKCNSDANYKWTYTSPFGFKQNLKVGTFFKTKDECEAARLNNEDINAYACDGKYVGPKMTADVVRADLLILAETRVGTRPEKVPVYFSSMESCSSKLSKPFIYKGENGQEFTIEGTTSPKPNKVIKGCRKETLVVCDPKKQIVDLDVEFLE